jgi:hypothetical protein
MNNDNNSKLFAAGYTIIRKDESRLIIKKLCRAKSSDAISITTGKSLLGLSWQDIEKDFKTKAALKRRYDELLKDNRTIEG